MYDYGARMYMSDIGVFATHDPLSEVTFQPYAYAYNNPIFFNDPTGMEGEAAATDDSGSGGETGSGGGGCPNPPCGGNQGASFEGRPYDGGVKQLLTWGDGIKGAEIQGIGLKGESSPSSLPVSGSVTLGGGGNGMRKANDIDFAKIQANINAYGPKMGAIPDSRGKTQIQTMVSENPLVQDAVLGATTAGIGNLVVKNVRGAIIVNTIARSDDVLGHVFRKASGHVNPGTITSQNRYLNLFEKVGNNSQNINSNVLSAFQKEAGGFQGYSKTFRNGKQVWTQVRNGKIVNAGVNYVPK